MKIEDIIFRSVNAIGFAANAIALCLPYGSEERELLKYTSMICNFLSLNALYQLGTIKKDYLPAFTSLIAAYADGELVTANSYIDTEHLTKRYLCDGFSMSLQMLNMIRGFEMKKNNDDKDNDDGNAHVKEPDYITRTRTNIKPNIA